MKPLLTSIALVLLQSALMAQEVPRAENPKPAEPRPGGQVSSEDPFARPKGSSASDATVNENLLSVVETWSVTHTDFLTLLEESPDGQISHERVRELAKAKKAKLLNLIAGTSRSGHRFVVEAIDEVRYPTTFAVAEGEKEIAFPRTFETKNAGESLEGELVLGPDRKICDVSTSLLDIRFAGMVEQRAEPAAAPVPAAQFRHNQLVTSASVVTGRPAFIGTAEGDPEGGGTAETRLSFYTVNRIAVPVTPSTTPVGVRNLRIEILLFRLDRAKAQSLLMGGPASEKLYAAVRESVAKGEAELERTSSIVTKSGQRAVLQSGMHVPSPETYAEPGLSFRGVNESGPQVIRTAASPNKLTVRNAGMSLEVEPTLAEDGSTIDLNIVPNLVQNRGPLQLPAVFQRFPAQIVFETRKITTSLSVQSGKPSFLGTMSTPRDNGVNDRADSGKTTLAFVRATAVSP